MELMIADLNPENARHVNACDGTFHIEARLALYVEGDVIRYKVVKTTPARKQYLKDEIDVPAYMGNPDQTIFLATIDGKIAGQIILRRNWNRYAFVEDIAVDIKFRRQGVGRALILQAKQWARERNLTGLMLETQNNNVGACRFYESCGFKLGGLDRYLYQGIDPQTEEIALFWYWRPEEGSA